MHMKTKQTGTPQNVDVTDRMNLIVTLDQVQDERVILSAKITRNGKTTQTFDPQVLGEGCTMTFEFNSGPAAPLLDKAFFKQLDKEKDR